MVRTNIFFLFICKTTQARVAILNVWFSNGKSSVFEWLGLEPNNFGFGPSEFRTHSEFEPPLQFYVENSKRSFYTDSDVENIFLEWQICHSPVTVFCLSRAIYLGSSKWFFCSGILIIYWACLISKPSCQGMVARQEV